MADAEQACTRTSSEPCDVPIDWEALEDAFENNAPEVHSYLNIGNGEVLRVVDGIADPDMHARVASDEHYLRIEPVSSREQYRWMERFIPMVDDTALRERLTSAIDGKGAFRRFKDVLMTHAVERERWFTFRSERLRVFMEAWLNAHALRAVPRPVWPTDKATRPRDSTAAAPAELRGRHGRGAETLRKKLRELSDTLGVRDLEKVVTFAEFVRARRAARTFAHRHDATNKEGESEAENSEQDELGLSGLPAEEAEDTASMAAASRSPAP
ncbi:UPF0158 family protein [Myxococcota bacterium]